MSVDTPITVALLAVVAALAAYAVRIARQRRVRLAVLDADLLKLDHGTAQAGRLVDVAANTDPQVWPDSFAIAGGNHAHVSSSHGEHGCPYPARELAEVIAHTAVEVLLDRLPDVRLAAAPTHSCGGRPC
jgi:hypothetical protein